MKKQIHLSFEIYELKRLDNNKGDQLEIKSKIYN